MDFTINKLFSSKCCLKNKQIFGYAYDIALIVRNIVALKELLHELEKKTNSIEYR